MRKQRGSTACPIVYSLDIWGDPWSLVILRDVLIDNKRHYREFLGSPERIATNVLSSRLQSLVKAGLLTKTEGPNRAQISYRPTRKALDLLPAILAIMHWGSSTTRTPTSASRRCGNLRKTTTNCGYVCWRSSATSPTEYRHSVLAGQQEH